MGYYDYPESYDYTVTFECKECQHENVNVETSAFSSMGNDIEVDCEKCGYENTVSLEDASCHCQCDYCRC